MVTKQQQLEWLARLESWPSHNNVICMDHYAVGIYGGSIPIAKEEWQQERDKMQKQGEKADSWHERGELPPVGCVVDVTCDDVAYGYGESDCEVLAHIEDCAVIRMSFGLGCFVAKVLSPSRTEREKAIDALIDIICAGGELSKDGSAAREIAERIYDAGMLK